MLMRVICDGMTEDDLNFEKCMLFSIYNTFACH